MSVYAPLREAFEKYADADPEVVKALAVIVIRELASEDHRRRQAALSHESQMSRLQHIGREAVSATAADRRVPFDQRNPNQFPRDILPAGWAVFADGDIVAMTRLEDAEGRKIAWRALVQRDSDDMTLYRAPYWIGGFETKGAYIPAKNAEARARAKLTNLYRDGFELMGEIETTGVIFATLDEARAHQKALHEAGTAQAKAEAKAKAKVAKPATQKVVSAVETPKVRKGVWAGMTDAEVSAEISRRWEKRRKSNPAKTETDDDPTPPRGGSRPKPRAKSKAVSPPSVKAKAKTGSTAEDHRALEVYRTPLSAVTPLLDYRPEWFSGRGYDPSAGDGRMLAEIVRRGNAGPHAQNEIRASEWPNLARMGDVTIGDYLALESPPKADFLITNPPFSLTDAFIEKAITHVRGPIIILQQSAWATSAARSVKLKRWGLSHVLNLKRRPCWEMDNGAEPPGRYFGFSWFVFEPGGVKGLPTMDWLDHPEDRIAA